MTRTKRGLRLNVYEMSVQVGDRDRISIVVQEVMCVSSREIGIKNPRMSGDFGED